MVQATPNSFSVPCATLRTPGWRELVVDCDPAVQNLAMAGLSAVAAGTEGGYEGIPLLGASFNEAGQPSLVSQQFYNEFHGRTTSEAFELATSGIRLIAAARAVSALFNSDRTIDYPRMAGEHAIALPAHFDTKKLVNAVFGDIDSGGTLSNVQILTAQEERVRTLQFAATTGYNTSIFAQADILILPGRADAKVWAGRRRGDFAKVEPSWGSRPIEKFAQALQIMLASS